MWMFMNYFKIFKSKIFKFKLNLKFVIVLIGKTAEFPKQHTIRFLFSTNIQRDFLRNVTFKATINHMFFLKPFCTDL